LASQQGRFIMGGLPVVSSERMDAILRALGHTGQRNFFGQRPAAEAALAERIFAQIGGRDVLRPADLSPQVLGNVAANAAAVGTGGAGTATGATAAAGGVMRPNAPNSALVNRFQAFMGGNFAGAFAPGMGADLAAGRTAPPNVAMASTFQAQIFSGAEELLQHVLMQSQRGELERQLEQLQQESNAAAQATAQNTGE